MDHSINMMGVTRPSRLTYHTTISSQSTSFTLTPLYINYTLALKIIPLRAVIVICLSVVDSHRESKGEGGRRPWWDTFQWS